MGIDLTKYSTGMKPRVEEWPSMTIKVETPDGLLYLTIMEDDKGKPCKFSSTFGKTGTSIAAWAKATDQLINLLLENGVGINEIIDRLSGTMTEKPRRTTEGIYVKSGPDGIPVAFMTYKREKVQDIKELWESDFDEE